MSETPASLSIQYEKADTHCPFCQAEIDEIRCSKKNSLTCQKCHKHIDPGEDKESLQRYGAILSAKMKELQETKDQSLNEQIEKGLEKAEKAIEKSIEIEPALEDYLILADIYYILYLTFYHYYGKDQEKAARALKERSLIYEKIAKLQPGSLSFLDASDNAYDAAEFLDRGRLKKEAEEYYVKCVDYAREALKAASEEEIDFLEEVLCYRLLDASFYYKDRDDKKAAGLIQELLCYKENLQDQSLTNAFGESLPEMIELLEKEGLQAEAIELSRLCERIVENEWRDHPDEEGMQNVEMEIVPLIRALALSKQADGIERANRLLQRFGEVYASDEAIKVIEKKPGEYSSLGEGLEYLLEDWQDKTVLLDGLIDSFCQAALTLEKLFADYPNMYSALHLAEICRYIAAYYAAKDKPEEALLWAEKSMAPFESSLDENEMNIPFEEAADSAKNLFEVLDYLGYTIEKKNKEERKRLRILIRLAQDVIDRGWAEEKALRNFFSRND